MSVTAVLGRQSQEYLEEFRARQTSLPNQLQVFVKDTVPTQGRLCGMYEGFIKGIILDPAHIFTKYSVLLIDSLILDKHM